MKAKVKNKPTAEEIAEMADRGEDVTKFFAGKGKMMPGYKEIERKDRLREIQRVNVDFSMTMLKELDEHAARLNISRQAVIKTFVQACLERAHLADQAQRVKSKAK